MYFEKNLTDETPIVNKNTYANGIADIIPSVSNSNNKYFISNVSNFAKTSESLADASSKITQAVKSAKELNPLKEIKIIITNKKINSKTKDQSVTSKIIDKHKSNRYSKLDFKGNGFHSFKSYQ